MKSVTVRLDEETLEKLRVRAAERNVSLSRFIGEALGRDLRQETEYEAAYRGWREARPFPLSGPQQPYRKREEPYDRAAMRREDEAYKKEK